MSAPGKKIARIAVCGGGLAAHLAIAALARQLPRSIRLTWVKSRDARDADLFYGSLSAPTAYSFNLAAGVSEPRLILGTDTTFAWGTQFVDWGAAKRSWVQCFHLPFPIVGGVLFHHHLLRHGIDDLESLLMPAVAARRGAFAHPIEKGSKLLSRAEYGYQFDPYVYREPFAASAAAQGVEVIAANITDVECRDGVIAALRLSDGQSLEADLFVDCTGPAATLMSALQVPHAGTRRLKALLSYRTGDKVGPPCRIVTGRDFGWQSETSLQKSLARLTVYSPESESRAVAAHGEAPFHHGEVTLGRRERAWEGNCVALGHAAAVLEPVTHAPMLILQREIERLLSLIPVSHDMAVERREFNRQSEADFTHAEIFNRALSDAPAQEPIPEPLAVKLTQFESRGVLVAFDLEPFNAEDWTILHYGMGRKPARYDLIADQLPAAESRAAIETMARDIEKLVKSMPSHHDYLANLVRYLKQKPW